MASIQIRYSSGYHIGLTLLYIVELIKDFFFLSPDGFAEVAKYKFPWAKYYFFCVQTKAASKIVRSTEKDLAH